MIRDRNDKMNFAFFLGCNIPARVQQYEISARAVLAKLDITVEDEREFKCCGNPIRNTDFRTFAYMAARNLALAERRGLDLLVLCKCCFGSLKNAAYQIERDPSLAEAINGRLAAEGLRYRGTSQIKHFLSLLYHDIGVKTLKEQVHRPFKNLSIATHYGCHALRPSAVTGFDNAAEPTIFDALVTATGCRSIDWPLKLECCGAPLLGVNDALSMDLAARKLADGKRSGADYLCVACPYCQMQFDNVQNAMISQGKFPGALASVLYPQLLGLSLGIESGRLGLDMNAIDIRSVESFLDQE